MTPNEVFTKRFCKLVGDATQEEIAKKVNVSRQCVGLWLRGKSLPGLLALVCIAEAYSVSIDYLLGLTKEKEPASAATGTSSEVSSIDDTNNIPCTHDTTDLHICQERIAEKCREVLEILKEFRLKDMLCLCVQDDDNYISFFMDDSLNYSEFNGEEVL